MNFDKIAGRNEPGFWRELYQQARLIYALMRDPEVPVHLKIIPFSAIAYFIMPFDLLPDFAVGLGQLDDLTVILVLAKLFVEMVPNEMVKKHLDLIRTQDGFDPTDETVIIDQDVAEQIFVEKEPEN